MEGGRYTCRWLTGVPGILLPVPAATGRRAFTVNSMPELSLALFAIIPLAAVELVKTERWRVLFGAQRPTYAVCLRALLAGQVTNALAPLRAGEAVRLGVLGAQGGAVVPGAGGIAGEKAVDTLCLGAIAFGVAGASVFSRSSLGVAAGLLVLVAGIVLALRGEGVRQWLETNRVTRKLRLAALVDVARALRDPQVLATVLGATVAVWVAGLGANLIILAATGTTPTLELAARVIVAGYLVNVLPSPPAQIGVYEAAVTVALTSAGVPLPAALEASVSLHVAQLVKLAVLFAIGVVLTVPAAKWAAWIRVSS
jgi:uncharacterized membrane protein YbhN (UPF0104 family)